MPSRNVSLGVVICSTLAALAVALGVFCWTNQAQVAVVSPAVPPAPEKEPQPATVPPAPLPVQRDITLQDYTNLSRSEQMEFCLFVARDNHPIADDELLKTIASRYAGHARRMRWPLRKSFGRYDSRDPETVREYEEWKRLQYNRIELQRRWEVSMRHEFQLVSNTYFKDK